MDFSQGRIIGIRHRTKKTVSMEARPTQIEMLDLPSLNHTTYALATENDELDFVMGMLPLSFRPVTVEDDLKLWNPRQIKWRKLQADETVELPETFIKKEEKLRFVAERVPVTFDGLKAGDTVAMILGGSGDLLGYALAQQAKKIGARLLRIPPSRLKAEREADTSSMKDNDALLLAELARTKPELFYEIKPRDEKIILMRECLRARTDALKARMAGEQRFRQLFIGQAFVMANAAPEGSIEKAFDKQKVKDPILQALHAEETRAEIGGCSKIRLGLSN